MGTLDDGASSSSTASTSLPSSFDVFLSFRGKDTRRNFVSFLHKALKDRGINVFVDSEKEWIGGAIGATLSKAIMGSKFWIIVISKGYANSKWCLRELALIVQCHKSNDQVLPIFFDVDPSHVRYQTGSFKEAFEKHEKNVKLKPDIVKEWRDALETVGGMIGEVVDETKDQAEIVESVVKRINDKLISNTPLSVSECLIGIDPPVNDMLSKLNIGSNDVKFVGICGSGGIGKTTIAKAVYNRILLPFYGHSFLSNVREKAALCSGLESLQKQLLKDIIKIDRDITDVHKGKSLIKERLCKEKVLVVLDDVDDEEQVNALVGHHTWFGEGSRVIITTRDEDILKRAKVDKIYRPEVFNDRKSLQLFSLHAFGKDDPPKDYMQLSEEVACYSGGLPLTLKVLGSCLSNIRDEEVWKETLQKLKEIPDEEVQKRLKISYDNLKDDYHKEIFLDVACFFIGWEKDAVIFILEACGYYPKLVIDTLLKRSLLKLEEDGLDFKIKLRMHDQIRDMGRDIVREENPMDPSRRSRLWSYRDILEVLEEHKGTGMTRGMSLQYASPRLNLASEQFQMMSNLKFVDISFTNFIGDFSHFRPTLRCFVWRRCSWEIIPTNFSHDRLVYLDLSEGEMVQAWNVRPQKENECFEKLKFLNLSDCRRLIKSPEFSWFPYLERLDLYHCISLEMLDPSIGKLIRLKSLILDCCELLKELPDGVGLLEKLEVLDAGCCTSLVRLPDLSKLKNLKKLHLGCCESLEEIHGLEGTESLDDFKTSEYYEPTSNRWRTRNRRKILGQGILLPDRQSVDEYYSLTSADGIYGNNTGSLILCVVFDPHSTSGSSYSVDIMLLIWASIRQKGKKITCYHEVSIDGVEFATVEDIIYIHYFKGHDWFGIPLQDNDHIEKLNIDISVPGELGEIKFRKLLYENKEPDQQMPNQCWSTCPFRDYFDWSCAYEASPSGGWSCVYNASGFGYNVEEKEQEQGLLNKGPCPSGVMSLDDCPNQDQVSHVFKKRTKKKTKYPMFPKMEKYLLPLRILKKKKKKKIKIKRGITQRKIS